MNYLVKLHIFVSIYLNDIKYPIVYYEKKQKQKTIYLYVFNNMLQIIIFWLKKKQLSGGNFPDTS